MYVDRRAIARNAEVASVLERMCQILEPRESQQELLKTRYEAVGNWLASADDHELNSLSIYLHGSVALGTMIRPIVGGEIDVDLVAFASIVTPTTSPALFKRKIGDRLRANGTYAKLLVEKQRCWRLDYAGEFHLDITPSIPNPSCALRGELVPDKALKLWKPTNPRSYKLQFLRRAALVPRIRGKAALGEDSRYRADGFEAYPRPRTFKGVLPRCVQILKRHRDRYFSNLGRDSGLAPISVVLTTLAAWSYEHCVTTETYDDELELLYDVVRHMPDFIDTRLAQGGRLWFVWNETTSGENFAEKWNAEPARAQAFFEWHRRALADIEQLSEVEGIDTLIKSLGNAFGDEQARNVLAHMTREISAARQNQSLFAAPVIGLSTVAVPSSTAVRSNTFFGN
ncbi:hypothetical protein DFR50_1019 [Roseiarcus fermentans]|uniref:Uncharacterized protein n=1 Tax=Roseiarcus fermentans TaxID=1473586 RepID=A0A366FU00_9HYPH|nr:nucleotidyltransferase [Roseiarcus fermentans]RBP18067.1 hypothetical protein DFR50_1019 [Roseiarcus fermentans]